MSTLKVRIATRRRAISVHMWQAAPYTLQHRAVVGIHVGGHTQLNFPDHMRWGEDLHISTCYMPAEVALRLDTFITRHYLGKSLDFGNFSFMRYVAGLDQRSYGEDDANLTKYVDRAIGGTLPKTTPYMPYVLRKSGQQGRRVLGLIGFTGAQSLCVLNEMAAAPVRVRTRVFPYKTTVPPYKPLIFASTRGLMEMCGADILTVVEGVSVQ